MRARLTAAAFGILVGVGLISCSEETPPAGPSPVVAVAVDHGPVASVASGPATRDVGVAPGPPVRNLIELPALEVGGTIQLGSDCATPATWASSDTAVATVVAGLVTGVSAGTARITETCGGVTSTVVVEVVAAPAVTFAFDPVPPSTIKAGNTGHFRVNMTRDGSRSRLTEGVTSSSGAVVLRLEGDRWRYTGASAGKAEIRVVHGGKRRLTHAITVQPPPQPDYEIARVTRYNAITTTADWVFFTWRARKSASRFEVRVKFKQGAFFSTSTETWYSPEAGTQERELVIPGESSQQWSSVTIEPADGRTCRGCGTFRRSDLPQGRNLTPAGEARAVRDAAAEAR